MAQADKSEPTPFPVYPDTSEIVPEPTPESDKKYIDPSFGMRLVIKGLKTKWPAVKNMATNELHDLLAQQKQGEKGNLLIIDARAEEEYNVGHLPSAVRIKSTWRNTDPAELQQVVRDHAPSRNVPLNVVLYCSIGYRSTAMAEKLRQLVKESKKEQESSPNPDAALPEVKVHNLEGSIFKWANEGRPMLDVHGNKTKLAHPFNVAWGQLLNRELRQWEGPNPSL